jgi:hypothetical protein
MSGCEIVFVEADRQWPVKVCIGVDLDRHEFVPWDFGHCVEDSIIQGGFADLGGEMSRDHSDHCNHLSALTIEKFNAHERPQLHASRDVSQVRLSMPICMPETLKHSPVRALAAKPGPQFAGRLNHYTIVRLVPCQTRHRETSPVATHGKSTLDADLCRGHFRRIQFVVPRPEIET